MNINNKNLSKIEIVNESIKVTINEGKKQYRDYWIAEIENDEFGGYNIKGFVKAKEFNDVKIFKLEENKKYVVQFGKTTSKDTSRRNFLEVENGTVVIK